LVLDALAGLGHVGFDGLLPAEIVLGLMMAGEIVLGEIGFVEEEAGGLVLGLEDIEAEVAGLAASVGSVVERGFDEWLQAIGFDEDGDGDDVHGGSWYGHYKPCGRKRQAGRGACRKIRDQIRENSFAGAARGRYSLGG
jgi:hypothetical protein